MIAPGHQVNSIFQHQSFAFLMDEISGQPLDAAAGLRRLRVQHMRFLALLARLGSLTACAKALHLSQPAVSNLLKDLETAFGVRLVDRDARGGRLSPAGARVLDIGCGDGALLAHLQQHRGCTGYGVELDDAHVAIGGEQLEQRRLVEHAPVGALGLERD